MNALFADTFYFLALLNRDDDAHARAVAIESTPSRRLVTTGWVHLEVADALSAPANRHLFSHLRQVLGDDPNCAVVPVSQLRWERGVVLYEARPGQGVVADRLPVLRRHGGGGDHTGAHG